MNFFVGSFLGVRRVNRRLVILPDETATPLETATASVVPASGLGLRDGFLLWGAEDSESSFAVDWDDAGAKRRERRPPEDLRRSLFFITAEDILVCLRL